jgi:hypothetical protein
VVWHVSLALPRACSDVLTPVPAPPLSRCRCCAAAAALPLSRCPLRRCALRRCRASHCRTGAPAARPSSATEPRSWRGWSWLLQNLVSNKRPSHCARGVSNVAQGRVCRGPGRARWRDDAATFPRRVPRWL